MRLSILGYKQSSLLGNGIGMEEVMLLRHFADFITYPNMKNIKVGDDIYYWLSYKKVIEDLPLLNLSTRTLPLRYEKLVKGGLLDKHIDKTRSGTYIYFKLTDKYYSLLEDNKHHVQVEEPKKEKVNDNLRFEDFYSLYPKKVNRGKAETAFKSKVKDEETLELIVNDLKRRKDCKEWKKENGKYIPHPSTYLNGKRWLDDYETDEPEFKLNYKQI